MNKTFFFFLPQRPGGESFFSWGHSVLIQRSSKLINTSSEASCIINKTFT